MKQETHNSDPNKAGDESWEQYLRRRINDGPDHKYLARHQRLEEWVNGHNNPETKTILVCGYLAVVRTTFKYFLDSRGQKFKIDSWDHRDFPKKANPISEAMTYALQHPRVDSIPNMGIWDVSLTQALEQLGCAAADDWGELISIACAPSLNGLVGKRVRVSCTVGHIREDYYYEDSCYDRVYLVPSGRDALEVNVWGRSAEDTRIRADQSQTENDVIFHKKSGRAVRLE